MKEVLQYWWCTWCITPHDMQTPSSKKRHAMGYMKNERFEPTTGVDPGSKYNKQTERQYHSTVIVLLDHYHHNEANVPTTNLTCAHFSASSRLTRVCLFAS